MTVELGWKVGFEIELMAPQGVSRRDLAARVAAQVGGEARRIFHPESEHSKVPGTPVFENLTLGYRVADGAGNWVASFVDDLTLQADCDKQARPKVGWYRIVSDDRRLLRLAARHCDAQAPVEEVLVPFAQLFGVEPQPQPGGMVRVSDEHGASLAIAAPLPGERERPCEIVSAPIESDHLRRLDALLGEAASLGFTIPKEGATHIHFEAAPLKNARFLTRFAAITRRFGSQLRDMVGTNPACIRLGDWSREVHECIAQPGFADLEWQEARRALAAAGPSKYVDYNIANMVGDVPGKPTFEVRILPATLDSAFIIACARLFESILRFANESAVEVPETLRELVQHCGLGKDERDGWIAEIER